MKSLIFWRNWSWPARILSGAALGFVTLIFLLPFFARAREPRGKASCSSNLRQLGLGLLQYARDYDDVYPRVATGGSAYGWADALYPYVKSTQIYHCPKEPTALQQNPSPRKNGYTDYPFNGRFSGKSLSAVDVAEEQVLMLDGNAEGDVTDARYSFGKIPPKWRQDQNSPLYRHNGMASYFFADGHVKALGPTQVEDFNSPVF